MLLSGRQGEHAASLASAEAGLQEQDILRGVEKAIEVWRAHCEQLSVLCSMWDAHLLDCETPPEKVRVMMRLVAQGIMYAVG